MITPDAIASTVDDCEDVEALANGAGHSRPRQAITVRPAALRIADDFMSFPLSPVETADLKHRGNQDLDLRDIAMQSFIPHSLVSSLTGAPLILLLPLGPAIHAWLWRAGQSTEASSGKLGG